MADEFNLMQNTSAIYDYILHKRDGDVYIKNMFSSMYEWVL